MKPWVVCILVPLVYFYSTNVRAEERSPKTSKPVTLQLLDATPQALSNAQQEIIALKQQLQKITAANSELSTLLKQKKEVNTKINAHLSEVQHQSKQNNIFTQELAAKFSKKPLNVNTKKKLIADKHKIKIDTKQLANLRSKLREIKTKIMHISPERKKLLQKLHDKRKYLKDLQLSAEMAKVKDRI